MKADVREFNAYLDAIQAKVYEVHRRLIEKGEHITAENVRDVLTGVIGRPKMILEIFEDHNKRSKS